MRVAGLLIKPLRTRSWVAGARTNSTAFTEMSPTAIVASIGSLSAAGGGGGGGGGGGDGGGGGGGGAGSEPDEPPQPTKNSNVAALARVHRPKNLTIVSPYRINRTRVALNVRKLDSIIKTISPVALALKSCLGPSSQSCAQTSVCEGFVFDFYRPGHLCPTKTCSMKLMSTLPRLR